MASQNAIELIWTVENASQFMKHGKSYLCLSKCILHLDCCEGEDWEVRLFLQLDILECVIRRPKAHKDNPKKFEMDCYMSLLNGKGERWGKGKKIRESFKYLSMLRLKLAAYDELVDSNNQLLVQDCLRVSVLLWPVSSCLPQPITFFARSSRVGVQRTVTCALPHFSTLQSEEYKEYPVGKISQSYYDLEVILCLEKESLSVRLKCGINYHVMLKAVVVVRSDCVEEVVWEEKTLLQCNKNVQLIEVQKLMSNKRRYLPNDKLTIVLILTDYTTYSLSHPEKIVFGTSSMNLKLSTTSTLHTYDQSTSPTFQPHGEYVTTISGKHSEFLAQSLAELQGQETFTDFSLRVGTESIPVHRNVLGAISPVFKALITSAMVEAANYEAIVPDFRIGIVRRLVRFMYTGSVPDLDSYEALDLFSAADKYGVLSLRDHCSSVLVSGLSPQTVCLVLALSDRHSVDSLKQRVLEYIGDNESLVINSEEWAAFMEQDPQLALEAWQYCRKK